MGSTGWTSSKNTSIIFSQFYSTLNQNITMSVIKPSHIERAVKFVSSNTTKLRSSEVGPVSSILSESEKPKLNEYQHQFQKNNTNKEDMIQKFPPKKHPPKKILFH